MIKVMKILRILPDKVYLQIMSIYHIHRFINFMHPVTFSDKIQWLKINYKKPEYTIMVDKYRCKKFVSDIIGEEYIIPTIGVWKKPQDIEFDKLPNQFVLKCNNDSGGVIICKDKSTFDFSHAVTYLTKRIENNGFWYGREWPYKNVKPCIIAEKYMKDSQSEELRDYKFYCFNGEPKYCQVISNRNTNETIDFFDMKWKHQEFSGLALPRKPFSSTSIPVPLKLNKMIEFAKALSKGIPFIRVDFYEVNGSLYFGELTFFPASGFGMFTPNSWNYKIGKMIKI